jgi:hypothetical protein
MPLDIYISTELGASGLSGINLSKDNMPLQLRIHVCKIRLFTVPAILGSGLKTLPGPLFVE